MAKVSTSRKMKSKRSAEPKHRRKIGRYVLVSMMVLAMVYVGKDIPFKSLISDMELSLVWAKSEESIAVFKEPKHVSEAVKKKVSKIVVEGELNYLVKESLKTQLSIHIQGEFLRIDLNTLREALIDHAWVYSASVKREWPSTILVSVEEQVPIARWSNKGFVNRYGDIVFVSDLAQLGHLPVLLGDDKNAYAIAKDYLTMSRLMSDRHLFITELTVGKSGHWRLEINKQFDVELGDRDITSRVERFLYLYEHQLEPLVSAVESIDMRYVNGVAVKWRNSNSIDPNTMASR